MGDVLWLPDVGASEGGRVGGKGLHLAQLHAAGFAVPEAFIIPNDASWLRAPICEQAVPKDVFEAFDRMAACGAVAVRSSALGEDSERASFAGQYGTVLGVVDRATFVDALNACVSVPPDGAAAAYRAMLAPASSFKMAVVVQRLIEARVGGVAFGCDPVSGDERVVLVEARERGGEPLLSGAAEPDRLTFLREGLAVVDEQRAAGTSLSVTDGREVAALALQAEVLFGPPQDIEFAIDAERLWILQSRAITTKDGMPERSTECQLDTRTTPADVWTSANVQEILPGALTPLTMTLFAGAINAAYYRTYRDLHLLCRDERPTVIGCFSNHVYMNVNAIRMIGERTFGSSGDAAERALLGASSSLNTPRDHSLRTWGFRVAGLAPTLWMLATVARRATDAERRVTSVERRLRARDVRQFSDGDLAGALGDLRRLLVRTFEAHLCSTTAAAGGLDVLGRIAGATNRDQPLSAIVNNPEGTEGGQIAADLRRLGNAAQQEGLAPQFLDGNFNPFDPELSARWRKALATFLQRHGHRGANELELATPTWANDPKSLARLITARLEIDGDDSLTAKARGGRDGLHRPSGRPPVRLGVVRGLPFAGLGSAVRRWVALRERTKSLVVRSTRLHDLVLPEVARRLVERGTIESTDDVFFLTADEAQSLIRQGLDRAMLARVRGRRRSYFVNQDLRLTPRAAGRPQPLQADSASSASVDVLRGTPGGRGIGTGRARVVHDARDVASVLAGEVLVAPATDAAWSVAFPRAEGLVVEVGSVLSHGTTIAREFGVPTVVGVRHATTAIHTGDIVCVDGFEGTVTVLRRAAEDQAALASE